jgi:hypothetical protein
VNDALSTALEHGHRLVALHLLGIGANRCFALEQAIRYLDYDFAVLLAGEGATWVYKSGVMEAAIRHDHAALIKLALTQSLGTWTSRPYGLSLDSLAHTETANCSHAIELARKHEHQEIVAELMSQFVRIVTGAKVEHFTTIHVASTPEDYRQHINTGELSLTASFWPAHELSRPTLQEEPTEFRQRILGTRLRRAFAKAYTRLVTGSMEPQASDAFFYFGSAFRFGMAWKTGFSAVRKLVDKKAPTAVGQVVNCLMIADSMRDTIMLGKDSAEQNASREE